MEAWPEAPPLHHLRETSHPPAGVQAGHRPEQQLRMGGVRGKRGTRERETGEGNGTTLHINEYTTAYSVSTQNGTIPNARGEKKMHSMTQWRGASCTGADMHATGQADVLQALEQVEPASP